MDAFLHDLKHGLRLLLSRPAFTVASLLALALGIGATTAIFSVTNAVLLMPPPYRDPGRLVMIWHDYGAMLSKASVAVPAYVEYRDHVKAFESVAAATNWSANLTGSGEPERVQGARVTANFLSTIGVAPALGRDFLPEEDRPGGDRVVLVSHGLWQRRFAGDPAILGKTLALNGENHTVVGVLPDGFVFFQPVDLYKPIAFTPEQAAPENHGNEFLIGVARVKQGVTMAQAQSELDALSARLKKEGFYTPEWRARFVPLLEEMTGEIRPAIVVLMAAVLCLLLIACSNVANLLLARSTSRLREVAVRAALGAGRWRLVRQLLTESVVLGVAGGLLGLLVAYGGLKLLVAATPPEMAQAVLGGRTVGLDRSVLLFTFLVSVLTGLVFGLAPALQTSRPHLNDVLKEGGRGEGMGGRGHRMLGIFVVSQVAVALVLLVGAGLLVRSFLRLREVDPGFDARGLLTMRLTLPQSRYAEPAQTRAFDEGVVERLGTLPGATAVAAVSNLPMGGDNWSASFGIQGKPTPDGQASPHGDVHVVSAGYFAAMRIPLVRGRLFEPRDGPEATPVVIIDQVLADHYFPGADPIGQKVALYFEGSDDKAVWREVVGIVGHVKKYGLDGRVKDQYYVPMSQYPVRSVFLVLRASNDPMSLAAAARAKIRELDADMPVFRVQTMDEVVNRTLTTRRFAMSLLVVFAVVALVLAAVGLYGVISYSVAQRTREIGLRMALGAQSRDVVRMVVRRGMTLTGVGLAVGLLAALGVTRFLASLLFSVRATDPLTFLSIAFVLAAVAWLASFLPARRAARVDPMIALRDE